MPYAFEIGQRVVVDTQRVLPLKTRFANGKAGAVTDRSEIAGDRYYMVELDAATEPHLRLQQHLEEDLRAEAGS